MASKEKWVTVNGRHVQVKDGKLAINKKSDKKGKKEIKQLKIEETNKFKQKEVKKKGSK